jgi:hypothetical protein
MSSNVGNKLITPSGENGLSAMKDWQLTKRTTSVTTGVSTEGGEKDLRRTDRGGEAPRPEVDHSTRTSKDPAVSDPKVATRLADQGKSVGDTSKTAPESKFTEQQVKFREEQQAAGELTRMAKGTVQKSGGKEGAKNNDGAKNAFQQAGQQQAGSSFKNAQNVQHQNVATQFSNLQSGRVVNSEPVIKNPTTAASEPKGPDVQRQGVKTVQPDAVNQASKGADTANVRNQVASNAGQAAAAQAGPQVEKGKQTEIRTADNSEDKPEESKEDRRHTTATNHGRSKSANRQLGGLLTGQGGTGSSTTTDGNDTAYDFELNANAIDRQSIVEGGEMKVVGVDIINGENIKEVHAQLASAQLNKDVLQLFSPYKPKDVPLENWKPDVGAIGRVIIDDIKGDIAEANKLLAQYRIHAHDSPDGRGWSV